MAGHSGNDSPHMFIKLSAQWTEKRVQSRVKRKGACVCVCVCVCVCACACTERERKCEEDVSPQTTEAIKYVGLRKEMMEQITSF